MTSSLSPSTENHCSDAVFDAANLSKNTDVSFGHVEAEDEEDEEGDMDFNPFLKEAPSLEASSSLCSEIEEFDADVVDSRENNLLVPIAANEPDELQDHLVGNESNDDYGEQTVMQAAEENEPTTEANAVADVTVESSQPLIPDKDDEDAIWKRTRARYSLVGSTLDELETFLQETDDEDDLHHNIDDEEEYRKFLAAVLLDGDASSGAAQENENVDEDEDNDADFELELEEALGSDDDETLPILSQEREHEHIGRRPKTRQKKRQKTDLRQNRFSGQHNRPLRPILPYVPIVPLSPSNVRSYMVPTTSSAHNDHVSAFTPHQIGQLHCMMYEHVQLLVQVFSLTILEPSRQHISTQVHRLLSEMLQRRDQVVASRRVPYPGFCFHLPYIRSAVTLQNTSESSTIEDGLFWVPFVSDNVLSVIDVAPLSLVRSYTDDVSIAVQEHHRRQLEVSYDATVDRECLFPFEGFHSVAEPTADKASEHKSKAAALVERSKKQSVALVPKEIAKLTLRFFPLFNPALFPHKPPPASVANRVLFTDAEDGLLARGLMQYNTDWKEIQKNFLPCKTENQIFVRQKNRVCSRAPENPIKAVRRMKTSPLTPQEKALITEGLKVFKLDWMSVWRYVVPHRDPSLLSRQWRTAVGDQKSYKTDEHTKAKRRLYESKRRKSKFEGSRLETADAAQNREGWTAEEDANLTPGFPRCRTLSDKENRSNDNVVGENNNGDNAVNNEDGDYVHEAFLADSRPGLSNCGENQSVELFTHRLTNDSRLDHPNSSFQRVPAKIISSSGPEVNVQGYQARISDGSRLVKLAPDLPPVNLPPTVRVMSQSAFTKYRDEASNRVRESLSQPRTGQLDEQNSVRCDAVEKGDSDLQMHPLLFQDAENERSLPYYPLNGNVGSCSSFDFFTSNPPQLNLNLFHHSQQENNTLNFFNSLKSKELSSSFSGVDFHPLLQRTDDENGHSSITPLIPQLLEDPTTPHQKSTSTPTYGVPPSPNELDLDIRLSTTARKDNCITTRESEPTKTQSSSSHRVVEEIENDPDPGAGPLGIRSDEIVMEQEELSDSEEEEMAESVEFECEEMTDTEGESGSDSDHAENVQVADVQHDPLPRVDSDQDEPRCQQTSKSNLADENDEPRSLLGLSLTPKPQVTRNSRSSHANRSSKNTTLSHPQLDSGMQIKKPRKRAQKLDLR
uniref:uncharacterized protein LOC122590939 n=1 Tax=Erigeron canadensis TaxID=72917 RepID=UPI001CB9CF33|nr:uncharacterized protein LOC122590939 [Erigeron canadensis]